MNKKIHLIVTGGTIDAAWDGRVDTAVIGEGNALHSILPLFFANLIIYSDIEITELCMKDSRRLAQDDVIKLTTIIEESPATKIIITHGTYTMPDTAKYIKAHLKRADQTIILVGSMVPLRGFSAEYSDAGFNLGYAVAKVEELPSNVYLAMNGRTFNPEEVAKSLSEGKFYSVFDRE